MFSDDDLLPLSALADLCFCERRAALHFIEMQWQDNAATLEGTHLHQQVDLPGVESRGNLRIARGLLVKSHRLGLSGKLDVVEFHKQTERGHPCPPVQPGDSALSGLEGRGPVERGHPCPPVQPGDSALGGLEGRGPVERGHPCPPVQPDDSALSGQEGRGPWSAAFLAAPLPDLPGLWSPFPVEYKKGRLRKEEGYEVQLCAQALCLEEMLGVHIPAGAIYYGANRRRLDVEFTAELRAQTESAAARLHELIRAGLTPKAFREAKCERCSLLDRCRPEALAPGKSAKDYLAKAIEGGFRG